MSEEFMIYLVAFQSVIIVGLAIYVVYNQSSIKKNFDVFSLKLKERSNVVAMKMQASERVILYLERNSLNQILTRVSPNSEDKSKYMFLLTENIQQEYEHNIAQQIYLSIDSWNLVSSFKNSCISTIRTIGEDANIKSANQLREQLMKISPKNRKQMTTAVNSIKREVLRYWE